MTNPNECYEAAEDLLKLPDGLEIARDGAQAAHNALPGADTAVQEAVDRLDTIRARQSELNNLAISLPKTDKDTMTGLLDELVFGDPPISDLATKYDALGAKSRYVMAALSRVVEYHYPRGNRAVLAAQVERARVVYEDRKAAAIFSLVPPGQVDGSGIGV
jgi:hypothetical protein